jgi:hypothetical protein
MLFLLIIVLSSFAKARSQSSAADIPGESNTAQPPPAQKAQPAQAQQFAESDPFAAHFAENLLTCPRSSPVYSYNVNFMSKPPVSQDFIRPSTLEVKSWRLEVFGEKNERPTANFQLLIFDFPLAF